MNNRWRSLALAVLLAWRQLRLRHRWRRRRRPLRLPRLQRP